MSYIECTSRLTVYVWAPELSSLYSEMHEACSGTFFEVHGSLIWFRSLCRGCRACQPLWWSDRPPLSSSPAPAVRRLNASLHAHWRPHYGAERSGISCAPTLQVTGRRGTGVRMKRVHNYVENKNYLVSPIPQPHPKELYLVGRQGNGAIEIKMVVFFFFSWETEHLSQFVLLHHGHLWLAKGCCLSDGYWLRPSGTGSDSAVPTVPPWEKCEVPYTRPLLRLENRDCVFVLVEVRRCLPPCPSIFLYCSDYRTQA